MIALAKFSWSLFYQWRHSSPPSSKGGESENSQSHDDVSAKSAEKPTECVNGGADEAKVSSESDVGVSKEKSESNGDVDVDGASTVKKRRRSKWVPEELRASAKQEIEKPYVPPAYYCEDEEQLDSEEEEEEEEEVTSNSDDDGVSQLKDDITGAVPQPKNTKENDKAGSKSCEQRDSANSTRKSCDKRVEDVTVKERKLSDKEDQADEDLTMTNGDGGSGVVMVSNTRDGVSSSWTRYQQKQLEWALVQYPKHVNERWVNIAKAVPGKSKVCTINESMARRLDSLK